MFKMSYLADLVEIRLQWCQGITDTGIKALTTHCPRLRVIDLKSCLITDDAVMSIAKDSKELKMLDISWCSKLTDQCLGYLATFQGDDAVDGEHGIEALYLIWCSSITEHGVELLSNLPTLKLIDLSGCLSVGTECVERLKSCGKEVIQ
jgi:bacterioferritin-associated ferredoxin